MNIEQRAAEAAKWALSKVGCKYSQANRTKANIFDCSSLVARAYTAQGKKWAWGGAVPTSMNEVYDDEFELLWPTSYAKIGKTMGQSAAIKLGTKAGDLQFLCTDSSTARSNRITHVTMVTGPTKIVHARSTNFGVRTDAIDLYSGKVCAITRYNPNCALRSGMKGNRTKALQAALKKSGADLSGDGEFGPKTQAAVKDYQQKAGLSADGMAGTETLAALGLLSAEAPAQPEAQPSGDVQITGDSVNVRSGPGTKYAVVAVAKAGERYESVDCTGWQPVNIDGVVCYISQKYCKKG